MNTILKLALLVLTLGANFSVQASPKVNIIPSVQVVNGPLGGTLLSSMFSEVSGAGFSGLLRSAVYDNGAQGTSIYYQLLNNISSTKVISSILQSGDGSIDLFDANNVIGPWYSQTNAAFGIFSAGTAKAGEIFSFIGGYCIDSSCSIQGSHYSTYTSFLSDGVIPGTEVLTGIAPGTASYTGAVLAGGNSSFPRYSLGTLYVDGQSVSAFVTAVPEPETYAMLLAGLGLIGSVIRSRNAKQS